MKIKNPSFEILVQEPGLEGIYKQIERAGRVCYKSEDKISDGSAKKFFEKMVDSHHTAMLEHGTVYLKAPAYSLVSEVLSRNKYSRCHVTEKFCYATTNMRVIIENGMLDQLKYLCEPLAYHEKRVTVRFSTQIAITREFNRHRVNSMAESSTRYCNYSKDKFGNEITINIPEWVENEIRTDKVNFKTMCELIQNGDELENMDAIDWWFFANMASEIAYLNLIRLGKKPQEARVVLPLDTNSDLIHTAFVSDWMHFFELRAAGITGAPHPDAKWLAKPLLDKFKELGYIS